MDEVAALMSQALETVAMASAVSTAAASTPLATIGLKTPLAPPLQSPSSAPAPEPAPAPARTTGATTAPPKDTTSATTKTTTPPKSQGQNSSSAFREADAAYMEIRNFANEIDGRCAAAVQTLYAASRAVAGPGKELNRSYEAYCHASRSLRAAERSVGDAEVQEDTAVNELRRAGEAIHAAEEGVARAAKILRDFDARRGNRNSSNSNNASSDNDRSTKKQQGDDGGGDDGDGDHGNCGNADREGEPPPALSNDEVDPAQNSTHQYGESSRTRETLRLALETAGRNADRVSAKRYRAQEAALEAMTLVGARTAGEWCLAAEAYDEAKKRLQRAGLEAIPKMKLFSEEARLFRNLNKLRSDTRQRLSAASQAREAVRVAAAEAVAVAVATRMSAPVAVASRMSVPVATAVAVKAAAEAEAVVRAATRSGADRENALSASAVKREGQDEDEKGGQEEEGENTK